MKIGKGRVIRTAARMESEELGGFVARIAAEDCAVRPVAAVRSLDGKKTLNGFEVKKAIRGELTGYIIDSGSAGVCAVRFYPDKMAKNGTECIRIENRGDIALREVIKPSADGGYVLRFEHGPVILVFGSRAALARRYRGTPGAKFCGGDVSAERRLADAQAWLKELEEKKRAMRNHFEIDGTDVGQIDLRRFATRRFADRHAGDGKDGWTDEGAENSLQGTPWGIEWCNGVPMDFIRYDQNDFKDVLVLGGGQKNVPLCAKGIPQ